MMKFLVRFGLIVFYFSSVYAGRICNTRVDVVFLVDGSDSITEPNFTRLKDFVANLIDTFEIGLNAVHVGMIAYSTIVGDTRGLALVQNKILLKQFAKNLYHQKFGTNTAAGIQAARKMIREQGRRTTPAIIVVITDGRSTDPRKTIAQTELNMMASSAKLVSIINDFGSLANNINAVRKLICTYRVCNKLGDIILLIDGSDSISDIEFIHLKDFVANLIDSFEIGPKAMHVGMIVYSSIVGEMIGLQPVQNKTKLKDLAKDLHQPQLGTNTAAGINAARRMLQEQGRLVVPKTIVVITDGRSTEPKKTILQANKAKAEGITMMVVGIGKKIYQKELDEIASNTKMISVISDFGSLANDVNSLGNLICKSIPVKKE